MSDYLKRKTLRIRHSIARRLVPQLYEDWLMHGGSATDVPRPMIQAAKTHFKGFGDLIGVEIGVFEGVNSLSILQELPMKRLFLIDPYIDTAHCIFIMKERVSRFPQAVLIRKMSKDAVGDIREKVDFVYIDGDHSYDTVKSDIRLYFDITKQNGIIGGHDYVGVNEGVKRAVDEFVSDRQLELHTGGPDWWVIK